jgi:hypothetical protein
VLRAKDSGAAARASYPQRADLRRRRRNEPAPSPAPRACGRGRLVAARRHARVRDRGRGSVHERHRLAGFPCSSRAGRGWPICCVVADEWRTCSPRPRVRPSPIASGPRLSPPPHKVSTLNYPAPSPCGTVGPAIYRPSSRPPGRSQSLDWRTAARPSVMRVPALILLHHLVDLAEQSLDAGKDWRGSL